MNRPTGPTRLDELRERLRFRLDQIHENENDPYGTKAFLAALDLSLNRMVAASERKLDAMVEIGNQKQAYRMLRFRVFGTSDKRVMFRSMYGGGPRSIDEQRRLYELWRERHPRNFRYPNEGMSHHERGPAIDMEGLS